VQNSWPRWGPFPTNASSNLGPDGKLYYWVTFSSTRPNACTVTATSGALNTLCTPPQASSALGRTQLYVTGVVVDVATGAITTYPAIYLWNQDVDLYDMTPTWDFVPILPYTGFVQ
jgi:hypothetical protein